MKFLKAFAALAAFVVLAVGAVWLFGALASPASSTGADRFDRAWRDAAASYSGERLAIVRADIRQQAADTGVALTVPGAYPAATTTPSVTPTPSATATPTEKTDSWKPHYYTLDEGKRSARSFGPAVTGNLAEVKEEFAKRMKADPALLCANGGRILNGQDGGIDCVKELLKSKLARDAYFDKVMAAIDNMSVETLTGGTGVVVKSAYMLVGDDGIPRVTPLDVERPEAYKVLTVHTKDGKTWRFRLECGFQWDNGVPRKPKSPRSTPPRGVVETPPCVDDNGRDKDGKCKPPKTTPSPSASTSTPPATPPATPTPTPSETPSTTPTPTSSATPTTTPSCVEKECETAPTAPPNRPTPSSTPTRSPEATPPARPSQPANTATPTVKATGATKTPKPTASVPQAPQPSATATGSISPPPD